MSLESSQIGCFVRHLQADAIRSGYRAFRAFL